MTTPTCVKCSRPIPPEDINVANDVAFCRACNVSYELSSLTHSGVDTGVDVHQPPPGAWYSGTGVGTVIGATHRSWTAAIGALVGALFWNGIVSIFVLIATAATLTNLGINLPHWFPAPDMHHSDMGVGMNIFLWLFLTPFIAIGLFLISAFLSSIGGRTEITFEGGHGTIFVGIGALGWRRRFDTAAVKEVRVEDRRWSDGDGNRQRKTYIILEMRQGKKVKFGTMLSEERRAFMAAAVSRALHR